MPEPGRGEVKRRLPVGERAHDARAPSDLAQDALERIVGANAPPVLLREDVLKPDNQIAMNLRQRAPCHDYAAIRGVRECSDGALDLADVAHVDRADLDPNRRRRGLDGAPLANPGGYSGIANDCRSRRAGRDLLE